MTVDVFAETRRLVSAREVAEMNGLHPNRSGFICCPLHHEKTPSLKLYQNGTWHCFGCGKGGSSIDLVAQLYGLDVLGAVRRMNADFHLGLPIDRQQTPQERTETARAAAKRRELSDTAKAFEADPLVIQVELLIAGVGHKASRGLCRRTADGDPCQDARRYQGNFFLFAHDRSSSYCNDLSFCKHYNIEESIISPTKYLKTHGEEKTPKRSSLHNFLTHQQKSRTSRRQRKNVHRSSFSSDGRRIFISSL